jgi:KTSC domain-containing protein
MTRTTNTRIVGAGRTALRRRVAMAREYMTSTSVEWIEYDANARTLEVAFASGGVYRYSSVPPGVCDQLRAAESKGRFVNEVVKKRYRYVRIQAPS